MVEAAESPFKWPPLESDPEIFNELLGNMGVPKDWGMAEVMGMDEELLAFVPQPCRALILAFEALDKSYKTDIPNPGSEVEYYMKQSPTLDDACGLIAAIHTVLNNLNYIPLLEGSPLKVFHDSVKDMEPKDKATFLENYEPIHSAHTAHAKKGQSKQPAHQHEVKHHYVTFIVTDKKQIVELDGTRPGPNLIAELKEGENFMTVVAKEILNRIEKKLYSETMSIMAFSKLV